MLRLAGTNQLFTIPLALSFLFLVGAVQSDINTLPSSSGPTHTSAARQAWAIQQAKVWLHYFQVGKVGNPSALSGNVRQQLTPGVLQSESLRLRHFGAPTAFSFLGASPALGSKGYYVLIQFKSGRVIEALAYDSAGKIAGIDFKVLEPNE